MYEMQPGLPCYFAQDVATLDPDSGKLCVLGTVNRKVVCLPDFRSVVVVGGVVFGRGDLWPTGFCSDDPAGLPACPRPRLLQARARDGDRPAVFD